MSAVDINFLTKIIKRRNLNLHSILTKLKLINVVISFNSYSHIHTSAITLCNNSITKKIIVKR